MTDDPLALAAASEVAAHTSEYHKIQTVWLRDPETNHRTLIEGAWAKPEFEYLANLSWTFTEKVDGTNIRIILNGSGDFDLGGKTDNAQLPSFLVGRLRAIADKAKSAGLADMILYGEGYGAKIQKGGGNYIADRADFVLFDVLAGDIWLERENVEDISANIEVGIVPIVGRGTLLDAIAATRKGFNSSWGEFTAEGLVMRPGVELKNRRGERVITKIKTKDFAR
jgi:hypothetical protein